MVNSLKTGFTDAVCPFLIVLPLNVMTKKKQGFLETENVDFQLSIWKPNLKAASMQSTASMILTVLTTSTV